MNNQLTYLAPEEKLVLALCRLEFSREQKEEIALLMKEVKDWDRFVRLANEHGVIALEAYNIYQIGFTDQLPDGIMKMMDNARTQTMIRNTWLVKRWKEVNSILTGAGIKHVLLKGMALEHTVYGSRGLRQMTDTDILVKKSDVLKAWLLLQTHGFQPGMIKSPLHHKIITEIGKHMPTLLKDGYPVEIHHRLFYEAERNKTLENAIDDAVPVNVEGTGAFVLQDDIHLEYLKKHHEDHMASSGSQLKLYLDMELISPGSAPAVTEEFLKRPQKHGNRIQRRDYYRMHYLTLPKGKRLRFLAGDIIPSLRWMKQRHGCGTMKALLLYPRRAGKLLWLIAGKD